MGTKNTVRLIDPAGTSYYLSGGAATQTTYAGSGTPWTSESTTPYELSLNDRTPIWVPQAAPGSLIMSGGPPFSLGRRLLFTGYDTIQEQVGVQMRATTKDNAIALLVQLRHILNTALYSMPCLLAVQGGTNTGYAEIYSADVGETVDYLSEPDGIFRATITWVRAPLFSAGSLTTLINAATFTNAGTGANNNTQSLGSITGDLLYEGSPLNIKVDPTSGTGQYYYMATVYQRTYDAAVAGTTTTSSTTGASAFSNSLPGTDPARTRNGLRLRVILRCVTISAKAQLRLGVISNATNRSIWIGPWVAANATGATLVDLTPSGVPLDAIRNVGVASGELELSMQVRSTDGSSVSVNVGSVESLLYYTFCRIDMTSTVSATSQFLQVEQANNLNGTAYVPRNGTAYMVDNSAAAILADIADLRGTLPRGISGASLYLTWLDTGYALTTTATAAVTVTHLPLYYTLRGGG